MKRVVVTGIGAVTPLGNTFKTSWNAAKAGISGIGPITRFNAHDIPWKIAGELKDFDPRNTLSPKELLRLDPFIQYAVVASVMAAEDAGMISFDSSRITPLLQLGQGGVIIGSSRGGITTLEQSILRSSEQNNHKTRRSASAYLMAATTIGMASSWVAAKLGMKGYSLGISNACASGANAIGEAYRLIKNGYPGPFLAGGTEAPICRTCIEGYGIAGTLSKKDAANASRPFDRGRDGFVLAEGACVLVLEGLEEATKREAQLYGEIIGYANTVDAFHQTKPHSIGEAEAIRQVIKEAGHIPDEIDYLNSHGTSTRLGDKVEAEAIRLVFGERAGSIPVSALKAMTGHMLAASGALETGFTLMTLREGIIPPTINLEEKDPDCALNTVTEKNTADFRIALSGSFGFGGVNAVLAFKRLLA